MDAKEKSKKRIYCDTRRFVAKAEAAFAKRNDVDGGWYVLEGLWRFLFAHCIYWQCVPYEIAYHNSGRGDDRCVTSMLREQAAMRRALLTVGCLDSRGYAKMFAAMAGTAAACVEGRLRDERCLVGTMTFFAAVCDWQKGPGSDIRQPKRTHKGGWTVRDGRRRSANRVRRAS